MRTSIILDDALAERFRVAAKVKGQSLSAFLADAGRAALRSEVEPTLPPFELETYGAGGAQVGIDLNRTSDLIAAEDVQNYGKPGK